MIPFVGADLRDRRDDGRQPDNQGQLFNAFCLEDGVPADHQLRKIHHFVDLSDPREHLAPFYSTMARLSVDPELMIRMLLVGYCFGIRSERRLCQKVDLNLAYRWFCGLGLEGQVPDHPIDAYPGDGNWTRLFSDEVGPKGAGFQLRASRSCPLPERSSRSHAESREGAGPENVEAVSADIIAMPEVMQQADVVRLHLFYHDLHILR